MKRFFSIILTMAMVFSMIAGVPLTARAAGDIVYMVASGENGVDKFLWNQEGVRGAADAIVAIANEGGNPVLDITAAATPSGQAFGLTFDYVDLTIKGDASKTYALAVKTNSDLTVEDFNATTTGTLKYSVGGSTYNVTSCIDFTEDATLTIKGDCSLTQTGTGANAGYGIKSNSDLTIDGASGGTLVAQGNIAGLYLEGTDQTLTSNCSNATFQGGTAGDGVLADDSFTIAGTVGINAKGIASGSGIKFPNNESLSLTGGVDVRAEGGASGKSIAVSGTGRVNFADTQQYLYLTNNSTNVETVRCTQAGTDSWIVGGEGYISAGNGAAANIECTVLNTGYKMAYIKLNSFMPAITTDAGALPDGNITDPYSTAITVSGSPASWRVVSGQLPQGLNLGNDGQITGTPTAGGTYNFVVEAGEDNYVSAPVAFSIKINSPEPTINVSSSGLGNLKVGQDVTGSIVYTLTNATYAASISAANFVVSGLPAGLTAGTAVRTSNTVITIPITGKPTTYSASTKTITIPTSIPKANVTGAASAIAPVGTVAASAIEKGDGAAVNGAPTLSGAPSTTSITVNAVTVPSNPGGQTVEYAISTSTAVPTTDWQTTRTFSSLIADTDYYVFARTAANTNYNAGTAQRSAVIKTGAPAITATVSGLNSLKVGQVVNGSVVFDLINGTYADPITASAFTVTGLPAGLSVGTVTRTSGTKVTVQITGTPTTANNDTAAITLPASIPAANVTGATNAIIPAGTPTVGAIAKGNGAAVSGAPTVSGTPTTGSIAVNAVTNAGSTGQAVEYAIATSTSTPSSGWQTTTTFSGLTAGTTYYVFARTAGNTNYNAGAAQRSAAIGTPSVTGVNVSPANVTVQMGTTQTFNANVVGANNPAQTVTWTVENGAVGTGIVGGVLTVSASETAGTTLTVRATSTVDGTKSGTATVVVSSDVVAPGITGPTSMSLAPGYTATSTDAYAVTGTAVTVTKTSGDDAITWNNTTKKLDIAAGLAAGSYPVVLTASGTGDDATLTFTLTVKTNNGGGGGGGGGGGTKYTVTFDTNEGSAIEKVSVAAGGKVLKPEDPTKEGYTLEGWYSDEELTKAYDFEAKVIKDIVLYANWVEATGEEVDDGWKNPFVDVKSSDWFYGNVEYAVVNGLFNGTSEDKFEPNAPITRAMFVTVLWRMEESPVDSGVAFVDVPTGMWYSQAVEWAAVNGIVNGVGDNKFAPNAEITREQIAAIIYRYEQFTEKMPNAASEAKEFGDWNSVSDYAKAAVDALVKQGIINGKPGDLFDPKGTATRAEVAAMLNRFLEAIQTQ